MNLNPVGPMLLQLLTLSCSPPPEGGFAIGTMAQPESLVESEGFVVSGLRFLPVSATTFQMGSPESENGRQPHPESDPFVTLCHAPMSRSHVTLCHRFRVCENVCTFGCICASHVRLICIV